MLRATGRKGFRFRTKPPTSEGLSSLSLRALPAISLAPPVTLQLKASDGRCWDARFTRPRVNRPGRFQAQSG